MNFNDKQKVIENIDDEVKVLHPLLKDVFRSMTGVVDVHYTHGTNEKGADFILCKEDTTLGRNHYVGVVVKKGKIISNISEVERQIDECQDARKLLEVKSEVRLTEVWVVNTSTVTSGAQDRIFEKFSRQKVEFINGEKLTELVDKYANYFWYDISADIGGYLNKLSVKLDHVERESSVLVGLDCSEFYVSPEILEFDKTKYVKTNRPQKPHFVNIIDEVLQGKVSYLEGEMGFGKSKTARHIAKHFCAPDRFKQMAVVPVFETFRSIVERNLTLQEALVRATEGFFDLESYPDSKVLFIFDGVDEAVVKFSNWDTMLLELAQEAKSNPQFHLLVTSRPLRKLEEQVTIFSSTRRYVLRPLSIKKLLVFIEKACENLSIPKRLFEDLQKSELFRQLPQSPIAAALLSRLIAQNSNDLPSNLTELYSKSIENLLGRWDITKGNCTEKEYRDTEQVSMDLAQYIVSNQLIYMSEAEARQRVESWHKERNTNTNLDSLMERVFEKSGLFTIDKDSGTLTFRHRSFGEYLYALNGYKHGKKFPVENSFDPYWVSVQFFHTGLLGDCEDHLRELLTYAPRTEIELWLKVLSMPEYFLAGYQTRYQIVENNLYKLFIDAANLFDQVKLGKTKTKLANMSEMHLLWFFQKLIRSAYEYDYFKRSIDATLINIDQEVLPEDIKLKALFFAASFAAELGDSSGYEYLVKNYGAERLPLSVSLAIDMEKNLNKDFTKLPLLKEHEKKLKSVLRPTTDKKQIGAVIENQQLRDLFDKPVKSRNFNV